MVATETISSRGRRCVDGGFTIIESLIASAILLLVSASILTMLVATATWYGTARAQAQANELAQATMATIKARPYADMKVSDDGVWPISIPTSRTVGTPVGRFSIATTITSILATVTPTNRVSTPVTLAMIQLSVTSLDRSIGPVTLTDYASDSGNSATSMTSVRVVCVPGDNINSSTVYDASPDAAYNNAGTPVELLSVDDMNVAKYTALTDANNVAYFPSVQVGQYWLTSDYTYPVVHPVFFPIRISPAAGGSAANPVSSVNEYNLAVTRPNSTAGNQAVLRIGAYRGSGWYYSTIGGNQWFTATTPYQPAGGLTIHAQPILNENIDPGYFGSPGQSRYPDTAMDFTGVVNGFGVAVINIPYTLDPRERQYWKVRATTSTRSYELTTTIGGSWTTDSSQPDQPSPKQNAGIPQFQYMTGGVQ